MKSVDAIRFVAPWLVTAVLALPGCKPGSSPPPAPRAGAEPADNVSKGGKTVPTALVAIPGLSCERPSNGVLNCRAPGFDISGSDETCGAQSASFGRVIADSVTLRSRPSGNARDRSGTLMRGQWVCVQYSADSTTGDEGWDYVTALPPALVPGCNERNDCAPSKNTGALAQTSDMCRIDGATRYAATCLAGWVPHKALTLHSMGLDGQFAEGASGGATPTDAPSAASPPGEFKRYAASAMPSGECVVGALIDDLGVQTAVVMGVGTDGRRRWTTSVPAEAGFYQTRATHCACSGSACYAAIATDTQPSQSVSQTLLTLAKLDPSSGKRLADRAIEPSEATRTSSTWMATGDELVIHGQTISLSGQWRSDAEEEPHRFEIAIPLF